MLTLLGIIAVGIAAYYAYKTAKDYDRNAVGWMFAVLSVGIGLQLIIPIVIGIIIGIVWIVSGGRLEEFQTSLIDYAVYFDILFLLLSFVGIALILRHISKVPEESVINSPPPPPNFSGDHS